MAGAMKTRKTTRSVGAFLKTVKDEKKRADCETLIEVMKEITGEEPRMWGDSLVGFGSYHYVYESGREGDWFLSGFSPRAQNTTIYVMAGFEPYGDLMQKLGPHSTGKSCLYVKRLEDIHMPTLRKLLTKSVAHMRKRDGKLCSER